MPPRHETDRIVMDAGRVSILGPDGIEIYTQDPSNIIIADDIIGTDEWRGTLNFDPVAFSGTIKIDDSWIHNLTETFNAISRLRILNERDEFGNEEKNIPENPISFEELMGIGGDVK